MNGSSKKQWVTTMATVFLVNCALLARAEEYWLKYRFTPNIEKEIVNLNGQSIKMSKTQEAGTAPKEAVDPVTATVNFPGKGDENTFRIVFGKTKADAPLRDRLWISRDGDWAKATVCGETRRDGNQSVFGPVLLKLNHGDGPVDYHAMFYLREGRGDNVYAELKTACYYEDRIELDGKTRRVALVDNNGNGRFDDVGPSLYQSDWLLIDLNDDGRLDSYGLLYKEVFTTGKCLSLGGKCYDLKVAADGATFSLEETKVPMGRIKTGHKQPFRLILFGEGSRLSVKSTSGELTVPCGKYQFVSADFFESQAAMEKSGLSLQGQSLEKKDLPAIIVTSDKTADLK
ncbi:MAG: hypothetical protein NTU88_08915, partial [Armatimonadetes bacterium]|nr:hypothetical protein [Armatimonadota bacterium]